jgi:hypothetical protein
LLTDKSIAPEDIYGLQSKDHGASLYALVDHGGMPGLVSKLTKTKVEWISLFDGSREENALSVAPILFAIPADPTVSTNQQFAQWLGKHGTYTSSVLLLASPIGIAQLARRLALRLDAMLPGDMAIMLRFFDPRIFEELVTTLAPKQKQVFLSIASAWWFIDRRGHLQQVDSCFADTDQFEAPLILTAAQESALIDASEPDQVAEMLLAGVPEAYQALPQSLRYDFITRHMAAAKTVGMKATHELALYCSLALLFGEEFAAKPSSQSILLNVKAGKLTPQQAAEQIEIAHSIENQS